MIRRTVLVPGTVCFALLILIAGCATVEDAARDAVGQAAGAAIEDRVESFVASYSDVMLYQMAYVQAFHLGGFGVGLEYFSEGEGTTWEVRAIDDEEFSSFSSERALLERNDDGTSWWYLRYTNDEGETIEFEVLQDEQMRAHEMYVRDPETGDVRHHEFEHDPVAEEQLEETEGELEEEEYQTYYTHLDDYDEYTRSSETIRVGAGTYQTDVLTYSDPEAEEDFEFHWWVSEDMPGFLVQFRMNDDTGRELLRGEVVEHRQDYARSLSL